MEERDLKDRTREHSPLTRADDAIHIDTTGMSIAQVVDELARRILEMENTGA